MGFPNCHEDPATCNDVAARATTGALYTWKGNLYRYVQIKDLATANGDVCCPDSTDMTKATQDRSADAVSTICYGVAVGVITADYYGYIQVSGYHSAVLTDGGVTIGQGLVPHATTDGAADSMVSASSPTAAEFLLAAQVFGQAITADTSAGYVPAMLRMV